MVREGISAYNNKEGEASHDLLGEITNFRSITKSLVNHVVSEGNWFTFCKKADPAQVDIMSIKNDKGISLGSMIYDSVFSESSYRSSIYKYLLRDFLCYYEAPIVKKTQNTAGFTNSFDKYLVTSNINVVASWLGITVEEATKLYGSRLMGIDEDSESDLYPYLKLYETKDHIRKVTKTRKDIDLGIVGTRIIPVFALKEGLDILYNKLLEDTYDVTFCKDSGQVRTVNTTFNIGKIKEVYNDSYVNTRVEELYKGDFLLNPYLERGYIRIFEMGSSVYDSPLRSINYARIVKFEKKEPDLTYINLDVESADETFKDYLYEINNLDVNELVSMLDIFEVGTSRELNGIKLLSLTDVENWVDAQRVLLSTVFLRKLALFMLGNPQWFKGYTGAPKDTYQGSTIQLVNDDEMSLDLG